MGLQPMLALLLVPTILLAVPRQDAGTDAPERYAVLEGRLVDPLGEPIRGFVLDAYGEALLPGLLPEGIVPVGPSTPLSMFEGRTARAVTDGQGRFRFEGIEPGRCFVQVARWRGSERGAQIEPTLHSTDGERVRLELALHRVELELPDGAEAFCCALEPYPRCDWDAGSLLERSQPHVEGVPQGRFTLKTGTTYTVGLWSRTRGVVERRVLAGAGGAFLQRPELELPEPAEPGHLELTVRHPGSECPVRVEVLAPLSRHVLVKAWLGGGPLRLPPGRYLVRVGQVEPPRFEPGPWHRFELVQVVREVVVRPRATTALEVVLTSGCRLQVLVRAPGAERVLVHERPTEEPAWRRLEFEPRGHGIVVGRFDSIPPGERRSSRYPLAVGMHELRVEAEGFAPRTVELEVAPGQVPVELDVALEPR